MKLLVELLPCLLDEIWENIQIPIELLPSNIYCASNLILLLFKRDFLTWCVIASKHNVSHI